MRQRLRRIFLAVDEAYRSGGEAEASRVAWENGYELARVEEKDGETRLYLRDRSAGDYKVDAVLVIKGSQSWVEYKPIRLWALPGAKHYSPAAKTTYFYPG